jgi:hypothetical protein
LHTLYRGNYSAYATTLANCSSQIIGEVNDGAVVSVEFTLHRYNHYKYGPVKRVSRCISAAYHPINDYQEYNCVAHRIEVISESYLGNVGFVKEGGGCRDDLTDNDVTKVVDNFELMSVE